MTADLHIHTTSSDGRYSPEEVVRCARKAGLGAIAITDHDTVDGLKILEASSLLNQTPNLAIIPGIEFTTDLPDNEVHILGYFIDIHSLILQQELQKLVNDRLSRTKRMIQKLNQLGYSLEYSRVMDIAGPASSIGRPHIAKALVEKGYFQSVSEVFHSLLQKGGPAYVPHYKLSPARTIELIQMAGGISVLAHPGQIGSDEIVRDIMHLGIQGLEVFHPGHNVSEMDKYLNLAKTNHLLITGGSDFHAIPYRYPERLGEFTISDPYYRQLVQAAKT